MKRLIFLLAACLVCLGVCHPATEPDGSCEYQVIGFVGFNGVLVGKTDVHLFSYYALMK